MAILDQATLFSGVSAQGVLSAQLVTALGFTIGNGVMDAAAGAGNQVGDIAGNAVLVSVVQSLTSAGAATVAFQLVQADDAALSVNLNVLDASDVYAYTVLTKGQIVPLRFPKVAPYVPRRYVGVRFVVAGAVLTNATGQFTAAVAGEGGPSSMLPPTPRAGFAIS